MKLKELLFNGPDDEECTSKVAIFTHRTPDPDSMASAYGLQWLLDKMDVPSTIFYTGEVSHPQNKTMKNIFGLQLKTAEKYDAEKWDHTIMVDGSLPTIGIPDFSTLTGIVDHHPEGVNSASDYTYSYCKLCGSCSTLIYELICEEGFKEQLSEESSLCTALLLGIISDTNYLLNQDVTQYDDIAYQDLRQYVDPKKLDSVMSYPLPAYMRDLEALLVKDECYKKFGASYVVFLGTLPELKRDVMPVFADKLLKYDDVTTSVVSALINNRVEACVRTSDVSIDIDAFCKCLLTDGGGRGNMGVSRIDLGEFWLPKEDESEEIKKMTLNLIKEKIFHSVEQQSKGNK